MPEFIYNTDQERAAIVAQQEALGLTMLSDDLIEGVGILFFDLDNHVPAVKGPSVEQRLTALESDVAVLRSR